MPETGRLRNQVAIVGAAVAKSVRHSDRPVGSLAVEMSDAAIADAGLTRADIDGVACGTSLPADAGARITRSGFEYVNSDFLAEHMELQAEWSMDDGSFPPALARAAMAVASGAAECVLVNRTVHNPPGRYHNFSGFEATGNDQWTAPYGYVGWISGMAMGYKEYQHRYGARREHMATFVIQMKDNVQRIPDAYWYGRPVTFDDYMNSRMISDPICLFDNDIPVDGGGSFVITTAARARHLPNQPVYITSWAKVRKYQPWLPGSLGALDEYYEGGYDLAQRLWSQQRVEARGCGHCPALQRLRHGDVVLARGPRLLPAGPGLELHSRRGHRRRRAFRTQLWWRQPGVGAATRGTGSTRVLPAAGGPGRGPSDAERHHRHLHLWRPGPRDRHGPAVHHRPLGLIP